MYRTLLKNLLFKVFQIWKCIPSYFITKNAVVDVLFYTLLKLVTLHKYLGFFFLFKLIRFVSFIKLCLFCNILTEVHKFVSQTGYLSSDMRLNKRTLNEYMHVNDQHQYFLGIRFSIVILAIATIELETYKYKMAACFQCIIRWSFLCDLEVW